MTKAKIMNIKIEMNQCFLCGKEFDDSNKKEKHHAIPKCLSPTFNILIPVHRECHKKINALYVSQQRKPLYDKLERILNNSMVQLAGMHDEVQKLKEKKKKKQK